MEGGLTDCGRLVDGEFISCLTQVHTLEQYANTYLGRTVVFIVTVAFQGSPSRGSPIVSTVLAQSQLKMIAAVL